MVSGYHPNCDDSRKSCLFLLYITANCGVIRTAHFDCGQSCSKALPVKREKRFGSPELWLRFFNFSLKNPLPEVYEI